MTSKRKELTWPLLTALASALALPGAALAQTYNHTYTQTETITYHDNTTLWKLGQVAQRSVDGKVVSSRTYDPTYALPLTSSSFGKLRQTVGYDLTSSVASGQRGTIATSSDGNNNTTVISQWKRGIPQSIGFADGTSQSAVVDLRGWLTSVTDQNGFTTTYSYDAMGRIAAVTHPTGDSVAWNATTQVFEQVNNAEYGIPAGHWRQTVTTGNRVKVVYFDAMWQPLVTREHDNADFTSTVRYQRFAYDYEGRTTFASYPGTTSSLSTGQWNEYDALGRPVAKSQDSEQGLLTTTMAYLPGFQTEVTDPLLNKTTTTDYLSYDQPTTDWPLKISHPEGAFTHITRETLGKPTRLRRSNSASPAGGTLGVDRDYTYNTHEELCRVVEPETGATLMGYDAAGNLTWSAAGLPAGQACEADGTTANVLARRATRQYDARNRLVTLSFPDSNGNQTWTYTPDGLPATITTLNDGGAITIRNTYAYNKRRMMTAETSGQLGWYNWTIGYTYNANGDLASQSYPTGLVVNYAPNALGQATQAGSYANGVQYHPNGAIKQFTYGNGLVHTMSQNARQLPARSTDTGGALDHEYGYDRNGNVLSTLDHNDSTRSRWMAYDGLDRLTDAGSVVFGGDHWHRFTYDQLDNLRSWKLAGVKDFGQYVYDANNRLSAIRTTAGSPLHAMTYDAQGNRSSKDSTSYSFDYGNRLRSVSSLGSSESYNYDGLGRRVKATKADGSLTLWMYASNGQQLFSFKGMTNQTTHENVYLSGSVVASIDHLWPSNTITAVRYQHTDALGSPVAESDPGGIVTNRINYDPYGGLISGSVGTVGYTGHVMDVSTGLTYMQQRYYDPADGSFLSVDAVSALSNPVGYFNRYRYAANNPYRFTDPDGRCYTSTGRCMTDEEFDAAWRGEAGRVLNAIGSPLGTAADVLNGEWQGAVVGIVLSRVPLGKQAGKYVDEVIDLVKTKGKGTRDAMQLDVEGDIDGIFEDLTRGGEKIGGGRVRMEDGTIIGRHQSTSGDNPQTIDIHRNDGQEKYKIRVRPPPPPPPPPRPSKD